MSLITFKSKAKGQAVLEFAGLICLVLLAFFALSMQEYLKNAIASRMKDNMGRTFGEEQYRPHTDTELHLTIIEQKKQTSGTKK